MPRKSASALATPPVADVSARRPAPPTTLTAPQAEVWVSVLSTYPADHFRPAERDLLALYCKHIVEAQRLSRLVETITDDTIKAAGEAMDVYLKLLRARDTETKAATSLARSMRITHQSRVSKHQASAAMDKAEREDAGRKLWEQ